MLKAILCCFAGGGAPAVPVCGQRNSCCELAHDVWQLDVSTPTGCRAVLAWLETPRSSCSWSLPTSLTRPEHSTELPHCIEQSKKSSDVVGELTTAHGN